FTADYADIRRRYRALAPDITSATPDRQETLIKSVDHLLMRIYAYISWGIRHQASSQHEIDETLERLGFRIPAPGDRRFFDVLAPMVILIALITAVFSFATDSIRALNGLPLPMATIVLNALISMMTASVMYG